REWGLDRMPVVAGANDQTAAALAAGLAQPGEAALGLGTAFVAYQVVRRDAPPPASRSYRGTYIGGLAYELALCSTAGAMMEWTRELFANGRNWDEIMAEALSAEPGCAGLRANPNFGADCREPGGPEATAALVGLRLRHERRHLLRAVLEGAACAAREQLDTLDAGGTIAVTGSGSANTEWMQLLADVTGRRLQRMAQSQATLWGTALLAGHGAGLFTDLLETARSRRQGGETFSPSGGNDGVYAQVYRDYLEISQSVQSGARRGRRPTEGARTSEASSEGVKRGA
ncbi:MAG: hypothetical protein KAX44_07435, partial [Candidatus Brocadiae bacterium]|nr:hypothetical protein [Candidatus Brocadiia bacterium]